MPVLPPHVPSLTVRPLSSPSTLMLRQAGGIGIGDDGQDHVSASERCLRRGSRRHGRWPVREGLLRAAVRNVERGLEGLTSRQSGVRHVDAADGQPAAFREFYNLGADAVVLRLEDDRVGDFSRYDGFHELVQAVGEQSGLGERCDRPIGGLLTAAGDLDHSRANEQSVSSHYSPRYPSRQGLTGRRQARRAAKRTLPAGADNQDGVLPGCLRSYDHPSQPRILTPGGAPDSRHAEVGTHPAAEHGTSGSVNTSGRSATWSLLAPCVSQDRGNPPRAARSRQVRMVAG